MNTITGTAVSEGKAAALWSWMYWDDVLELCPVRPQSVPADAFTTLDASSADEVAFDGAAYVLRQLSKPLLYQGFKFVRHR